MSTGVHKPSDIAVGSAIGAAVAATTTKVWPRIDPTPAHTYPLAGQTVTQSYRTRQGLTVIANIAAGNGEDNDALDLTRTHLDDAIDAISSGSLVEVAADGETFPGNTDFQVTKTALRLRTYAPTGRPRQFLWFTLRQLPTVTAKTFRPS